MGLDPTTLIVVQTIVSLVLTVALFSPRPIDPSRADIRLWGKGFFLLTLGRIALMLRGHIPDFVSIVGANCLLVAGLVLLLFGAAEFGDRVIARKPWIALVVIETGVAAYFTYAAPSFTARVVCFAGAMAIIAGAMAWRFMAPDRPELRRGKHLAVAVCLAYVAVNLLRAAATLAGLGGAGLLVSNFVTVSFLLLDLTFFLLFGLALLTLIYSRVHMALLDASAAKDILFREMNHRTKNNLALVQSLVSLAAGSLDDARARDILEGITGRIHSIALLHERLARLEPGVPIRADEYVHAVSESSQTELIRIESKIEPIELESGLALPLGMVVNELVTNAVRHAFPRERAGTVRVTLERCAAGVVQLTVADDGVGMSAPESAAPVSHQGLGTSIIEALVQQLRGELRYQQAGGTVVTLRFPLTR